MFGLEPEQAVDYITEVFGNKLVFVTCGAEGCWYKNKNAKGFVKALDNVDVIDTTGAGDIFGGSAMYGVLSSGKNLDELSDEQLKKIVKFATASAGLSTTKHGGISSVFSKEAVEEVVSKIVD